MTAHPTPSAFESRTNAAYEALMWALSRPGLARQLPEAGSEVIIETLLDRECAVYCDSTALSDVARRTGAQLTDPAQADHLFLTQAPAPDLISTMRQGTDMYPEDGATLIIPAQLGGGERLRLTGPGVDGHIDILVGGVPTTLWAQRAATMRYPMGFEMFLLDGDQVLGLPRSTMIEVL
jgi:alpha-D-ribose 1-methylphosphonate 5-triphosphate synthase subunit PhnH